jgi:TonB family protein
MRILLSIVFVVVLGLSLQAQKRTYLDANFDPTTKEKAEFYRDVISNENGTATVKDFFIVGQMQMEGSYASAELKQKIGAWNWFHANGQKAEAGIFDKKGKKTGTWKGWHQNGKQEFEGEYKKGASDGQWKWYFDNGQLSAIEDFSSGTKTESTYYNQLGVECNDGRCGDVTAMFKGGEDAFFNYLKSELKYPATAITKSSGQVWVRFKITKRGKIEALKVTKSVSPALDAEALRVIKKMPDWYPSKKHNQPVDVFIEIPLSFTK